MLRARPCSAIRANAAPCRHGASRSIRGWEWYWRVVGADLHGDRYCGRRDRRDPIAPVPGGREKPVGDPASARHHAAALMPKARRSRRRQRQYVHHASWQGQMRRWNDHERFFARISPLTRAIFHRRWLPPRRGRLLLDHAGARLITSAANASHREVEARSVHTLVESRSRLPHEIKARERLEPERGEKATMRCAKTHLEVRTTSARCRARAHSVTPACQDDPERSCAHPAQLRSETRVRRQLDAGRPGGVEALLAAGVRLRFQRCLRGVGTLT